MQQNAANLRHGIDGFTSPRMVSTGFEPEKLFSNSQHATRRPPKPL